MTADSHFSNIIMMQWEVMNNSIPHHNEMTSSSFMVSQSASSKMKKTSAGPMDIVVEKRQWITVPRPGLLNDSDVLINGPSNVIKKFKEQTLYWQIIHQYQSIFQDASIIDIRTRKQDTNLFWPKQQLHDDDGMGTN
jgi:hypothetical protein